MCRFAINLIPVIGLVIAPQAQAVDFRSQVLPLLSDRCFACHGPDEPARKADLRLDNRDSALDSAAIVPGDAEASLLVERIFAEGDAAMPPPGAKPLTLAERQLLKQWIAEGAEYAQHWAFESIRKPELPPSILHGRGVR